MVPCFILSHLFDDLETFGLCYILMSVKLGRWPSSYFVSILIPDDPPTHTLVPLVNLLKLYHVCHPKSLSKLFSNSFYSVSMRLKGMEHRSSKYRIKSLS